MTTDIAYLSWDEIEQRLLSSTAKRGSKAIADAHDTILYELAFHGRFAGLEGEQLWQRVKGLITFAQDRIPALKGLTPEAVLVSYMMDSPILHTTDLYRIFGHSVTDRQIRQLVTIPFGQDYRLYEGVVIGDSKVDVIGIRREKMLSKDDDIVAIGIGTDPAKMRRFVTEEAVGFKTVAQHIYLAATPFSVLKYLKKFGANILDRELFEAELKSAGVGLILVDTTEQTKPASIVVKPATNGRIDRTAQDAVVAQCYSFGEYIGG